MSPGFDQLPQSDDQDARFNHELLSFDPAMWGTGSFADLLTPEYDNGLAEDPAINSYDLSAPEASVQPPLKSQPSLEHSATHSALDAQFSNIRSSNSLDSEYGSSSTHSSSNIDSQNHTIFTRARSSSHSFGQTLSNVENMSHQGALPVNSLADITLHFLGKNPIFISPEARAKALDVDSRSGDRWANWEKNDVIRYFFGPDARVPIESPLPMSTPRAPKRPDQVAQEWLEVR